MPRVPRSLATCSPSTGAVPARRRCACGGSRDRQCLAAGDLPGAVFPLQVIPQPACPEAAAVEYGTDRGRMGVHGERAAGNVSAPIPNLAGAAPLRVVHLMKAPHEREGWEVRCCLSQGRSQSVVKRLLDARPVEIRPRLLDAWHG